MKTVAFIKGKETKFEFIDFDRFGQSVIKHPNGRLYIVNTQSLEIRTEYPEDDIPCGEVSLKSPEECCISECKLGIDG